MSLLEWLAAGILFVLILLLLGCAMVESALGDEFRSIRGEFESIKEELKEINSSLDTIRADVSSLERRFVDCDDTNLEAQ
jgi:hypothetical protein